MMNLMNILQQKRIALLVFLGLAVISIFVIDKFRLNLGVDFAPAETLMLNFEFEQDMTAVYNTISDNYFTPSRMDIIGDKQCVVFFQNIPGDVYGEIISDIGNKLDTSVEIKAFSFYPVIDYLLGLRFRNLFVLCTAAVLLYMILSLRGSGLTYNQVLSMITVDMLMVFWGTILLGSTASVLGEYVLKMDWWFIIVVLMAISLMLVINLLIGLLYVDYRETHAYNTIHESWNEFIKFNLKTIMFFVIGIVLVICLPFLFVGTPYVYTVVLFLVAIIVTMFAQYSIKSHLLDFLEKGFSRLIFIKGFQDKKW